MEVLTIIGLVLTAASMAANEKAKADAKGKEVHDSSKVKREPNENLGEKNVTAGAALERSAESEAIGAGEKQAAEIVKSTGSELTPDTAKVSSFASVKPTQTETAPPPTNASLNVQPGKVAETASVKTAPPAAASVASPADVPTPEAPKTGPGPKEEQPKTTEDKVAGAKQAYSLATDAAELFSEQQSRTQQLMLQEAERSRRDYETNKLKQNPYLWYKGRTSGG